MYVVVGVKLDPEEQISSLNPGPNLSVTMGLNWKSVRLLT